jgi:hypothetical protein
MNKELQDAIDLLLNQAGDISDEKILSLIFDLNVHAKKRFKISKNISNDVLAEKYYYLLSEDQISTLHGGSAIWRKIVYGSKRKFSEKFVLKNITKIDWTEVKTQKCISNFEITGAVLAEVKKKRGEYQFNQLICQTPIGAFK